VFKILSLSLTLFLAACTTGFSSRSPAEEMSVKQEAITLSKDNTVVLKDQVNAQSINKVKSALAALSQQNPQKDLYLFLDTPGGSVIEGLSLVDFVRGLPNKVHTITQFSASMGYVIVQNLNTRYVLRSGILMSHRASMGELSGTQEQIKSTLTFYGRMLDNVDRTCSNRVGISLDDYKELIYNDLWLDAESAVILNHADYIANVTCDQSLQSSHVETINTLFGSYNVTFADCPLYRGFLKVESPTGEYNRNAINELFERFTYRKFYLKYE
jgi:ATP-dependent Clp protease protease subunit